MSQIKTERVDLRPTQINNLNTLQKNFGLSEAELNRCLFFSRDQDEPWIPPDLLEAIARQTGGFQSIASTFDQYVQGLDQIVYSASVTDDADRSYVRSGVATRGEKPGGEEIDTNTLAQGRALSAVLRAAGFDPFRAGAVMSLVRDRQAVASETQKELHAIEDQAALRTKDLRQIHALAEEKGLIYRLPSGGNDMTRYRAWLYRNFGKMTASTLSEQDRRSVINALGLLPDSEDFILGLSEGLEGEALIA